ncbi:hypothetical protein GN244_ATG02600 [Phytophthora infestans]|uniref:Uncharacterized protein n=1 Tax=Phytophthora infestans TaxID=4787 RepID=A0A833X188_PHYIN|nr:hypothetical protein GN244_ATG02600 [Phytophthora infestans]KAF4145799.1 hypothetical protein GN958_ATG04983 [Phytophthora infestans]
MQKHARDTSSPGDQVPPAKAAKPTLVCEYCNKEFTTRGIPMHQKKCAKKQVHDKAKAKKTRSYQFCILNEAVLEEILSFLGNQTLTKMQMITGDRYQQCEPELAKYCCRCENDNPVIRDGCCRYCYGCDEDSSISEARPKYGMTKQQFCDAVDRDQRWKFSWGKPVANYRSDCRWSTLESYMIEECGSKREWVRTVAKKDGIRKKTLAT